MVTDFEGLIQLVARSLYSEPDVFVRELIQNGHDSIVRRREVERHLEGRIDCRTVRPLNLTKEALAWHKARRSANSILHRTYATTRS